MFNSEFSYGGYNVKKYVKSNIFLLLQAILFSTITAIIAVRVQFFKGDVLDFALVSDVSSTVRYGLLLLLFILFELGFYYLYDLARGKFAVCSIEQVRRDFFASLLRRKYPDFLRRTDGEYIAQYTNEMEMVENQYFSTVPLLGEIVVKIAIVSISLFLLDYRIALITLVLLTMPLYVPKLAEKKLQKAQMDYVRQFESHLRKLNDWLRGFEVIKNYAIEEEVFLIFDESNRLTQEKNWQKRKMSYVARAVSAALSYISHFIIIAVAAYLVLKGDFSAGRFFIAAGMIDQLSYPIVTLSYLLQDLVSVKPVNESVISFCSYKLLQEKQTELHPHEVGRIEYENVTFGFDDRELFAELSMSFEKNRRYLIQGTSGSGKTTLIDMLVNYYSPQSGSIMIDQKPVEELSNLYELITIMRQDAFLFEESLRNNLTMYRKIPDEKLFSVLRAVGLNYLASIEKLDMTIQAEGENLSGGEKKRIGLARSLLRETPILILDEPLANLDAENVSMIENLILGITDRTLIVISHQFSEKGRAGFEQILSLR